MAKEKRSTERERWGKGGCRKKSRKVGKVGLNNLQKEFYKRVQEH